MMCCDFSHVLLGHVFMVLSYLMCFLVMTVFFSFYSFRQSLKHQSVIKSQLKHKEIITSLCEDILLSFHSCVQLAEQMTESDAQVKRGLTAL